MLWSVAIRRVSCSHLMHKNKYIIISLCIIYQGFDIVKQLLFNIVSNGKIIYLDFNN